MTLDCFFHNHHQRQLTIIPQLTLTLIQDYWFKKMMKKERKKITKKIKERKPIKNPLLVERKFLPLFFWKWKYWKWMKKKKKKLKREKKTKSYKNCYVVRNKNIIYESWLRARNRKKSEWRDQQIKKYCSGNVQSQILIFRKTQKAFLTTANMRPRLSVQNYKTKLKEDEE